MFGYFSWVVMWVGKGVKEELLIVVVYDFFLVDVIIFKEYCFVFFIIDVGGVMLYMVILVCSMVILLVVGMENVCLLICDGELFIVDGLCGVVMVDLDLCVLEEYKFCKNKIELEEFKFKCLKMVKL